MELRAAVLLNDEEFKANDIKKHITRFSKRIRNGLMIALTS